MEIKIINRKNGIIVVNYNQNSSSVIPDSVFKEWLTFNGKLEWSLNKIEAGYANVEVEGNMTYEEYWNESTLPYINQDIIEFITNKNY